MLVVIIGWVLFRFEDISQAWIVMTGMFGIGRAAGSLSAWYALQNNFVLLAFCLIAVTPIGKLIRSRIYVAAARRMRIPRLMCYLDAVCPFILLILSVMALVGNSYNPFLYFQF